MSDKAERIGLDIYNFIKQWNKVTVFLAHKRWQPHIQARLKRLRIWAWGFIILSQTQKVSEIYVYPVVIQMNDGTFF